MCLFFEQQQIWNQRKKFSFFVVVVLCNLIDAMRRIIFLNFKLEVEHIINV